MVDVKQSEKLEQRITLQLTDLKSILQHSKINRGFHGELTVLPSRYRKIISDYYSLNAVEIEGLIDNYATNTPFFILSGLDKNGNTYKVIKKKVEKESKAKCNICDCGRKRFINPETGICYYKEAIATNYTTKI